MTILMTGGGTGGHITPLISVAQEIKRKHPKATLLYVGERNGKFKKLISDAEIFDRSYYIYCGKIRRYHNESWWQRLLDIKTNLYNLRDIFLVGIGFFQSLIIVIRQKPNAIFQKGGYVGVPVGIAGVICKKPIITHDSDASAGLANKILSRWAYSHAVAHEKNLYPYDKQKTVEVGVVVNTDYTKVTDEQKMDFKDQLNIPVKYNVLLVTGGSSGADAINKSLQSIVEKLLKNFQDLFIIHQTGKGKAGLQESLQHKRLQVVEFLHPMHRYTGASDIVVCRTSANTIAELAAQQKSVITVPAPHLADGHQLKNAEVLQKNKSAVVIHENKSMNDDLYQSISQLLGDDKLRLEYAHNLHKSTKIGATEKVADLLIEASNN